MIDSYKKVLEWYYERPKWQRIIFFVFIAILVGLLFVVSLIMKFSFRLPPSIIDEKLEEAIEEKYKVHKDKTEKESNEIDNKLKEKIEEEKWYEEEESKEMEQMRNAKKEIDNATSFDDIDRAVKKHFGRK